MLRLFNFDRYAVDQDEQDDVGTVGRRSARVNYNDTVHHRDNLSDVSGGGGVDLTVTGPQGWDVNALAAKIREIVREEVGVRDGAHVPPQSSSNDMQAPISQDQDVAGAGGQGTAGLPTLPAKMMEAIKSGKYVSFDVLLSAVLGGAGGLTSTQGITLRVEETVVGDAHSMSLASTDSGKLKVVGMEQWIVAWTNFFEVFAHFHPHLIAKLITYPGLIVRYYTTFKPFAWIAYDMSFREKVARDATIQWDKEDERLYSTYLRGHFLQQSPRRVIRSTGEVSPITCFSCGLKRHVASRCTRQAGAVAAPICRRFNGANCRIPACKFRHICIHCSGDHPVLHCPRKP